MPWHYATRKEDEAHRQKRKSMGPKKFREYEREEQRKFDANPDKRHVEPKKKRSSLGKTILGGSGG